MPGPRVDVLRCRSERTAPPACSQVQGLTAPAPVSIVGASVPRAVVRIGGGLSGALGKGVSIMGNGFDHRHNLRSDHRTQGRRNRGPVFFQDGQ